MSKKSNGTTTSAVADEFESVKKITDVLVKNWPKLAPDTRSWLKSRFATLPTDQLAASDADLERV